MQSNETCIFDSAIIRGNTIIPIFCDLWETYFSAIGLRRGFNMDKYRLCLVASRGHAVARISVYLRSLILGIRCNLLATECVKRSPSISPRCSNRAWAHQRISCTCLYQPIDWEQCKSVLEQKLCLNQDVPHDAPNLRKRNRLNYVLHVVPKYLCYPQKMNRSLNHFPQCRPISLLDSFWFARVPRPYGRVLLIFVVRTHRKSGEHKFLFVPSP